MNRGALTLVIMAVTLTIIACSSGLSRAEEHFNAGVDLQEQGLLQEAFFEQGFILGSKNEIWHFELDAIDAPKF